MHPIFRAAFNQGPTEDLFQRYVRILEAKTGPTPFRLAETPLFLTHDLMRELSTHATELVEQLSEPSALAKMREVVPVSYDVPGMDALPHCVQIDFALCPDGRGGLQGRVVELQAFPSLYALETLIADSWAEAFASVPGLDVDWTCFVEMTRSEAVELMRRAIVADYDPKEVALVDIAPEAQKTWPDFVATKLLFGVESVCITKLIKEGRRLFREENGQRIPVRRIYNRIVFDELEAKKVKPPFLWNEDLDITWCAHPNWYWVWSKYSLPFLKHEAVPEARFLSEVNPLPRDLENYVLKPLFSFAGSGVVVDVTPEAIERVPVAERGRWILQRKVEYAPAVRMPDGNGVKAEVRVMLMRAAGDKKLVPLLYLVRLSRGKMLGVDYNKDLTWVGGSVAMWER